MTRRENILKAIRFETPEYIPMDFVINDSYWNHYPHEAVFELIESHPLLFPDFKRPEGDFVPPYLLNAHADKPYTDPWGCVWMTAEDGITGAVHGHPLDTWEKFRGYNAPDPIDWNELSERVKAAKEKGIIVHMHSDGDIRTLADDLVDGGVDVINLQDRVNGIDWIAETLSGKICVDLDVDRQEITHHGTPGEIDALIREEVEKIGSRQGGLMMIYGLYPGVSLENACALMDAMEKYRYPS